VEEVNLRWIQTCWSSSDGIIHWGNGTDSSFGWDLVGFDLLLEKENWGVTEDKGDLILENWE
jgi:hypothetical protein